VLLFTLTWIMGMTRPLFTVLGNEFSGRDIVLLVGGLFLIYKATHELYERIELDAGDDDKSGEDRKPAGAVATVLQILALDVVFSLDSVITAVGMARAIVVMMAAMIIAVAVMFAFAGVVSEFVNRHPSMKILALAFLLLIGVLLTADAFGHHINRGYVYFAMAFSLVIELMNMRFRKKTKPRRAI
jgi:predicted tellurium resistance membrane protein TerC